MIYNKIQSKEYILQSLSNDLEKSNWIDGFGCIVVMRKKAINQVFTWVNEFIVNDNDFDDNHGKVDMYNLFYHINNIFHSNADNLPKNLIINDDKDLHLPIPIFSYIRPDMGTQFIFLSLGQFSTEIDLIQQQSL